MKTPSITKEILKKGHILYAEFANVPLGKRAEWLENLVKDTYEAGQSEVTPEYKKDMEESYQKGRKETLNEVLEVLGEEKKFFRDEIKGIGFYSKIGFNSAIKQIKQRIEKLE